MSLVCNQTFDHWFGAKTSMRSFFYIFSFAHLAKVDFPDPGTPLNNMSTKAEYYNAEIGLFHDNAAASVLKMFDIPQRIQDARVTGKPCFVHATCSKVMVVLPMGSSCCCWHETVEDVLPEVSCLEKNMITPPEVGGGKKCTLGCGGTHGGGAYHGSGYPPLPKSSILHCKRGLHLFGSFWLRSCGSG